MLNASCYKEKPAFFPQWEQYDAVFDRLFVVVVFILFCVCSSYSCKWKSANLYYSELCLLLLLLMAVVTVSI